MMSLCDIQNEGTKHENRSHYRVHPDIYRHMSKLWAIAKAASDARLAPCDDPGQDECEAYEALKKALADLGEP